MKLSIVIPAYNEQATVSETVGGLVTALGREEIDHEVIVVDDSSTDGTAAVVELVSFEHPQVRCLRLPTRSGFGFSVRAGLDAFEGDAVVLVMADGSESPEDVISYQRLLEEGHECVFGSRFIRGSNVTDYPRKKLIVNRMLNEFVRMLFHHGYNDTTNAFKAYRREVIESLKPFVTGDFMITAELPLKAIVRGYSYVVVPVSWTNRTAGSSKLALRKMGIRYVFIALYVFLEHYLSRGDYRRDALAEAPGAPGK
jgi:dolichol-phosphate mannosyltransferase